MAEYPTTIYPSVNGFVVTPKWKTIISETDAMTEQRKQKQSYAFYDVALTYEYLSQDDFNTLWSFYMSRKGAYYPFFIYDLYSASHETLWVGMGNAVNTTFDIPGKTTSNHIVYNTGDPVSASLYTIVTGGGAENSDRVTFNTAPGAGSIITVDFTGFLRMYVRFKEDRLSRESFEYRAFKTGVELLGLNYYLVPSGL
jgi:hypothetical protein